MQGFQRLLSEQDTPPGWLSGIIDARGRFLARVPQGDLRGGQLASEGWRQIKGKTGVFDFRSLEGTPIVQGNAHPSLAPAWAVGIAVPKSELQSAAWSTVRWAGLLGGALSIASLMLAFFLARRVSEPIAKLRENVAPLLEGETAEIKGSPEIDGLAEALRSAAADRKRGEEAAQQLAAIVRSSFDAIVGKRLDGTVTSWNRSAQEMFGYTADEMMGQSIRRIIPSDRQHEEDDILQRLALNQRIEPFETMRVRKDGRTIPVSITISPMTDSTGRVIGASKIARDITDQKSREEQLAFLLRELNHRSKNVLAVVQAIAHRTADAPARPFLQRFSERLQALSVNQDLLTRNDWQGIELDQLVKGQLAPFADTSGSRVRVSGPGLRVSAAAAQTIGMALHELATNASKYGALSAPEGTIDVTWSQEDDTFSLTWAERRGPLLEAPHSAGFGTFVLKTMAEQALGAVVALEHAASGLRWRLTAPLENVVDGR
jgi:PAS domain S-box-containing protein